MNISDQSILTLSILSIIGIIVFVNMRAWNYYRYLMLKKGVLDPDPLVFFFSNKDILLKIQVSFPVPIIIKNLDVELDSLRKKINIYTIWSYIFIGALILLRVFLIKG